jgi:squalene-hopene/tetraprenyl-beta-curcumene cyclase
LFQSIPDIPLGVGWGRGSQVVVVGLEPAPGKVEETSVSTTALTRTEPTPPTAPPTAPPRPRTPLSGAIAAARRYLLSIQRPGGEWCGELEGDSILESEYILTLHFLARTEAPRVGMAAEYLRRQQLPDGGWAVYAGGPADVSASVKAYFVLKLVGDRPDAPHMARARERILGLGGIEACNSFTRLYLAIFGQYSWSGCPAVPPELVLLPDWAPFSIYHMSSWSRAIVVPLSVVWAKRPVCPVPEHARIPELRVGSRRRASRRGRAPRERFWRAFFTLAERALWLVERASIRSLRRRALRAAEAWIHERLRKSDGLGAIFPPIVYTILAFRCLGYELDDPRLEAQVRELERLGIEEDGTLRLQPCLSPVWDTALAGRALVEAGPGDEKSLERAARFILQREVREPGDWTRACPGVAPGGWYFEYANEFNPDTDDTAEVLSLLARLRLSDPADEQWRRAAIERALAWQLAMQNGDGGWGAFDKDCDREFLTFVPFADHNAMIDPSCEDITGRTLEAFAALGLPRSHPAALRAVSFLRSRQLPDGTWYGRWGCNYIYGTALALAGLRAAGEDLRLRRYQRAADWLEARQNPDGGWGELPLSYDDPTRKGQGPSTPSQTAWALQGLVACGRARSGAAERGVAYLLSRQLPDGSWKDDYWTATGFPKVFYLRYHLYATYFPLRALAALQRERARRHHHREHST